MTIYHIFIDTDEHSNHVPVFLDREPEHHQGALKIGDDARTYFIYDNSNLYPLLLIDIGRAIERKERKQP